MSLPPPITATPGTFAHYTVRERLPRILDDILARVDDDMRHDARWNRLRFALLDGGAIEPGQFTNRTAYWRDVVARLAGENWRDQPFFLFEFLFYDAINAIALDYPSCHDVFATERRRSLEDGLGRVTALLDEAEPPDLIRALHFALRGNEFDLSMFRPVAGTGFDDRLVVDGTKPLIARLANARRNGEIHYLADNAGPELCFDLVLIDRLLATRDASLHLHLKPWPMFVSDALVSDVEMTLDLFRAAPSPLRAIGERLAQTVTDGRLVLEAPEDWGEPRFMDDLSEPVAMALCEADLMIAKGDLNYRRFFGDRAWPTDTPVERATMARSFDAWGLRVLKSDVVLGVAPDLAVRLFASDPAWRSNGRYGLIQTLSERI